MPINYIEIKKFGVIKKSRIFVKQKNQNIIYTNMKTVNTNMSSSRSSNSLDIRS